MPPPIIDEKLLRRIRTAYGERGTPFMRDTVVRQFNRQQARQLMERQRAAQGETQAPPAPPPTPAPVQIQDDNQTEIVNDPRNQEPGQEEQEQEPEIPPPVDPFGGMQNNVMDEMYGPQDPGAIALGRMKQLGVDVAGMTAADAQAALAKPIDNKKGTDIQQLRSRVQGAINARDPNYVSGWDMKKIKQARRKAFKKQKSMERAEAARRRAATPRILSPAAQLKQQLSANPIARRRAVGLMRSRSGAMGGR